MPIHSFRVWTALMLGLAVAAFAVAPAHAGDVSVAAKGGAFKIKGSDDADVLTLDQVGLGQDSIRVTPGAGTTVNGSPNAQVFGGLTDKGASIALGDGADILTLQNLTLSGKVKIKVGKGLDTVGLVDARLRGDTSIDAGGGDDALRICSTTFEANLAVKLGKGGGAPTTTTCGAGTNQSLNGSAVILTADTVAGNVTIKGGKGTHVLSSEAGTVVQGSLTVQNAWLFALCETTVGGSFAVKVAKTVPFPSSITCVLPSGGITASGDTAVAVGGSDVAGAVTLKGGGVNDTFLLFDAAIGGETKLDAGGGTNAITLDQTTVAGGLVVKAGKGADTLDVAHVGVQGSTTVKYGDGNNAITFAISTVGGDLLVKTGKGNDTIDTTGVAVTGDRTVNGGKGADTIL